MALSKRWIPSLALLLLLSAAECIGHPIPNSVVLLDVKSDGIACELQLPLGELDLALQTTLQNEPSTLVARHGGMLSDYIRSHVHLVGNDGTEWAITVGEMKVQAAEQTDTGPYRALNVKLWFQPPSGTTTRQFTLCYDAIMHQVLNHSAFVAIRQDWDNGRIGEEQTEVGVIALDPRSNTIPPLSINLDEGSI